MTVLKAFADGTGVVEIGGVRMGIGRQGQVAWMSDWARTGELESAGLLTRDVWAGNGTVGHDTFRVPAPLMAEVAELRAILAAQMVLATAA